MSTLTGQLDQLEAELQELLNKRLERISPLYGGQGNLAHHLVTAMRSRALATDDGILLAPDCFTVLVHPAQAKTSYAERQTLDELAELLQEIGKKARLHFLQPPVVTIIPDARVGIDGLEVITQFSQGAPSRNNDQRNISDDNAPVIPRGAFLIINGRRIFPLANAKINIGRRDTNDLITDDPRVSRQHAQLQVVNGCFEISDTDSTGGVFVNRKRVSRQVLRAGDVISLAGFALVYGQETSLVDFQSQFTSPEKDWGKAMS